jgi:hypothetical protein
MLSDSSMKRNLVDIERNRVTNDIVHAYAIGAITEPRSVSFISRISRLPEFVNELEFLQALYRIEDEFGREISGKAPCTRCGGLGYIVTTNGFDAGERYVMLDSERTSCPCCGG